MISRTDLGAAIMSNSPMEIKLSQIRTGTRNLGGDRRFEAECWQFEPFVDADVAAEFLMVERKTILDWARAGAIPAHRYGRGKRAVWRFRISELACSGRPSQPTMNPAVQR